MDLEHMPSIEPRVDKTADPKALARMYLRSFAKNMMTLRRLHIEGVAVDAACLNLVNAGQKPPLFAGEVAVLMHGRFSRTVPAGLA